MKYILPIASLALLMLTYSSCDASKKASITRLEGNFDLRNELEWRPDQMQLKAVVDSSTQLNGLDEFLLGTHISASPMEAWKLPGFPRDSFEQHDYEIKAKARLTEFIPQVIDKKISLRGEALTMGYNFEKKAIKFRLLSGGTTLMWQTKIGTLYSNFKNCDSITGISMQEEEAKQILRTVGILHLCYPFFIFIPNKITKTTVTYAPYECNAEAVIFVDEHGRVLGGKVF